MNNFIPAAKIAKMVYKPKKGPRTLGARNQGELEGTERHLDLALFFVVLHPAHAAQSAAEPKGTLSSQASANERAGCKWFADLN